MSLASAADGIIRTRAQPVCDLCGAPGQRLYSGLEDWLFSVQGRWDVAQCANADCGLLWLDPMPVEEDIPMAYAAYYTHAVAPRPQHLLRNVHEAVRDSYLRARLGYATGSGWKRLLLPLALLHPGGPSELAASAAFLPAPRRNCRILDVGCGRGDMLVRMRSLGWDVEGLDLDPAAVAVARSRGLTVRQGDLTSAHYPSSSFDAIYMNHVVEHVPDPVAHLRECFRVLAPGGRMVALTPNTKSWTHRHFGPDWRGLEPPRHLYLFSPASLARAAVGAGLERAQIRTLATGTRYFSSSSLTLHNKRVAGSPGVAATAPRLRPFAHQLWVRLLLLTRRDAGDELFMLVVKGSAEGH